MYQNTFQFLFGVDRSRFYLYDEFAIMELETFLSYLIIYIIDAAILW